MNHLSRAAVAVFVLLAAGSGAAQGVRERIRSSPRSTTVTQSQAEALTLTVGTASMRPIQTWVRTAGTLDPAGKALVASLSGPDAAVVEVGQRVRAFPPTSKSSMYQARVTKVTRRGNTAAVEVSLISPPRQNTTLYVIEIVVERPPTLSVPNEAIIEEGDRQVVYVQESEGQYIPRDIQTGVQGELYTQVLGGVKDGDQVVTFGSFFIDAEQKLKGTDVRPQEPASQ